MAPLRPGRLRAARLWISLVFLAAACAGPASGPGTTGEAVAFRFEEVGAQVGLGAARNDAYADGVAPDPVATMGTGLCWLDADRDGWLDLFVVNTWSEAELARWRAAGGVPRARLFRNVGGRFVDVSDGSGADLAVRGTGCAAADLDRDGDTDLVVTSAGPISVLWNDGDGTFTEGARAAGIRAYGWYAGVAIGDVNGDGWQDVVVAGYADLGAPVAEPPGGFPRTFGGVRDLLFLGRGIVGGRAAFREVGVEAGLEASAFRHGLGASLSDLDGDGDLDLIIANDLDPNQAYENVAWPGGATDDPLGLGFRLDEVAAPWGLADPNAGMGIAIGDLDGRDGPDAIVTNARDQGTFLALHASTGDAFVPVDVSTVPEVLRGDSTAFGVTLADLDRDGDPDVVLANGDVPVVSLLDDAEPLRYVRNDGGEGTRLRLEDASDAVGLGALGPFVARGMATADFDNDGHLDVAVAVVGGRVLLLRGIGGAPGWITVAPSPATPGTRVTVTTAGGRTSACELRAGSSYLSSDDPRCAIGLGDETGAVRVEVAWPDGRTRVLDDVATGRIVAVWGW